MKHKIIGGLLAVAVFSLGVLPPAGAQNILAPVHDFTGTVIAASTNTDGAEPFASLISSGSMLYGTAYSGGTNGYGIVFAVNPDGTGFTNLHSFTVTDGSSSTNLDGAFPNAGLILSGAVLFGTTPNGGTNGNGVVFAVNTDGSGFTNLYSFTGVNDGANPYAGLILSGGTLFGTAKSGGANGSGTVFAINTDGSGFTNLHDFMATDENTGTNTDGAYPAAGLILSGNTLYGTASGGGGWDNGTVFAVNTDGTGFTNLYSFTAEAGNDDDNLTNSDGAMPVAGLILSGNTLYGTASEGGISGNGAVFAVNTDGTGFTTLHSFTATAGPSFTNCDGASPQAALILSGNTLYGTTYYGGAGGKGAVFAVTTNGTGFAIMHAFTSTAGSINGDGANPNAGLLLSDNTLFGTTSAGGASGQGNVFSLNLVPSLGIVPAGNQIVLFWPTWAPNYQLQTETSLAAGNWSNLTSGIVTADIDCLFTNTADSPAAFFRLQPQ
jgi:uncharacterized repeat protein (TIGR03803 family)